MNNILKAIESAKKITQEQNTYRDKGPVNEENHIETKKKVYNSTKVRRLFYIQIDVLHPGIFHIKSCSQLKES